MLEYAAIKTNMGRMVAVSLFATHCASISDNADAASPRDWRLSDSIATTYFSDHDSNVYAWPMANSQDTSAPFEPRFILPSPNSRYFLFLTHTGLQEKDTNRYDLSIYEVNAVQKYLRNSSARPKPLLTVSLETDSSRWGAISDVEWLSDSSSVLFLGMAKPYDKFPQLMRADVPSGRVTQLTHATDKMESRSYKDGAVLYNTLDADMADDSQIYPVVSLERSDSGDLVWPPPYANFREATHAIAASGRAFDIRPVLTRSWILSGGKYAVGLRSAATQDEYILLNFETGDVQPLSESEAKSRISETEATTAQPATQHKLTGLDVYVRQSANEPPVVVASADGKQKPLTDSDPALSGVWIARSEPFTWQEPAGPKTGLLLKPRKVTRDKRLPLIIQIQVHADPRVFLPDGLQSSGYAAQVFAAQGYAVLIVPYAEIDLQNMAAEGPTIVARLDGAVQALGSLGLIDRSRVGLIGFSRNGYQTHYAVTHPARTVFAAAAVLDSFTGDYSSNLASGARVGRTRESNPYMPMAIESFWANKPTWLEHEFTFNVDRVRTPVLFTMHGWSPLQEEYGSSTIPILGAYRVNQKPIEYLWLPKATHALIRPQERIAEMGAVVDWMGFWLKDQVPNDPERAKRWEPLRKMQEASLRTPVPPKGRWVLCDTDELTKELCARKPQ